YVLVFKQSIEMVAEGVAMTQGRQEQPETIRAWLDQQGAADAPLHHIARALGTGRQETEALLQSPLTAKALLNLNRLALYRHLALVHRVWPNCAWFDWDNEEQLPVIRLIQNTFGRSLLEYVEQTYGKELVLQYWSDLKVPPSYADIILDEEEDDPLEDIPDDQIVFNPHLDNGDDFMQDFAFGSPETAACFRWLINSRYNYSYYDDIRTGYLNDPLGIQLAFDLRAVIKEEYWSPLPPDTLPAYLAIAQALFEAVVPKEYQEGRLTPLHVVHVADIPAQHLTIVQSDYDHLRVDYDKDVLVFDQAPVRAFVLDPECYQSPAALILTTHDEPGNPEKHRQGEPYRHLEESFKTLALALTPSSQVDLEVVDQAGQEVLNGINYGFHAASRTLCVIRANPNLGESPDGPIPIYRIPGGYMFQFNPEYNFNPQEMAVD
ncbi:hypothetical protein ACFLYO_01875, partial [Chloroflexota bacterium]